jgi:hypothetical protein
MRPRCGAGRRVAPAHRSDAHERPVVALAHDRELHHRAAPRVRLQRGLPESGARACTRPPAPPGKSCTRHGSGAALTVGTFRQAEASGATERPPAATGASAARGANRTRGQRAAAREEPRGQQARRRWECVGEADDRAAVGGGSRRSWRGERSLGAAVGAPSFCSPAFGPIAFPQSLPQNGRAPERTCTNTHVLARARAHTHARMHELVRGHTRTRTRARTRARSGHHPAPLALPRGFSGYRTRRHARTRALSCAVPAAIQIGRLGRMPTAAGLACAHRGESQAVIGRADVSLTSRRLAAVARQGRSAVGCTRPIGPWGSAHLHHIRAGTRLSPATSAFGLGSPPPHLRWDWAHPHHIDTGTRLIPATSAPGLEVAWCAGH